MCIKIATVLGLIFLSGCASNPNLMQKIDENKIIKLDDHYKFEDVLNQKCGSKFIVSLQSGFYKAELHGKGGIFYRGPAQAVTMEKTENCRPSNTLEKIIPDGIKKFEGGIFIPDHSPTKPRIYTYIPDLSPPNLPNNTNLKSILQPQLNSNPSISAIGTSLGSDILSAMVKSEIGKISIQSAAFSKDLSPKIVLVTDKK